ncbi:hypothetical protein L484_016356 [Morus notabilis]|uniref:Uncharacterized protein n=1 Tax=Morus notabilis TaxID=981085 RepID=W9QLB5_9ROSA|nr:hypothetical protein L484_016356 [Morus notabilis]
MGEIRRSLRRSGFADRHRCRVDPLMDSQGRNRMEERDNISVRQKVFSQDLSDYVIIQSFTSHNPSRYGR